MNPFIDMAKPILLIGGRVDAAKAEQISNDVRARLQDEYHVLTYTKFTDEPSFEVLNAEDMTPLQFEELKLMVEEIIKEPVK